MKTSLMLANNQALLIAIARFIPKITNDLFCRWSAYLIGFSDEANEAHSHSREPERLGVGRRFFCGVLLYPVSKHRVSRAGAVSRLTHHPITTLVCQS